MNNDPAHRPERESRWVPLAPFLMELARPSLHRSRSIEIQAADYRRLVEILTQRQADWNRERLIELLVVLLAKNTEDGAWIRERFDAYFQQSFPAGPLTEDELLVIRRILSEVQDFAEGRRVVTPDVRDPDPIRVQKQNALRRPPYMLGSRWALTVWALVVVAVCVSIFLPRENPAVSPVVVDPIVESVSTNQVAWTTNAVSRPPVRSPVFFEGGGAAGELSVVVSSLPRIWILPIAIGVLAVGVFAWGVAAFLRWRDRSASRPVYRLKIWVFAFTESKRLRVARLRFSINRSGTTFKGYRRAWDRCRFVRLPGKVPILRICVARFEFEPKSQDLPFDFSAVGGPAPKWLSDEVVRIVSRATRFHSSRAESGHGEFDVDRSIERLARRGGTPEPVFLPRKKLRPLLILENSLVAWDVRSPIARELADGLSRHGVEPIHVEFSGSLRRLWRKGDGRPARMVDFLNERSAAAALLVTDRRFFDPNLRNLDDVARLIRDGRVAWLDLDYLNGDYAAQGLPRFAATPRGVVEAVQWLNSDELARPSQTIGRLERNAQRRYPKSLQAQLGNCLLWAADLSFLPICGLGATERIRRRFYPEIAPGDVRKIIHFASEITNDRGIRFSPSAVRTLRREWLNRLSAEERRERIDFWREIIRETPAGVGQEALLIRLECEVDSHRAIARMSDLSDPRELRALRSFIEQVVPSAGEAPLPTAFHPEATSLNDRRILLKRFPDVIPEDWLADDEERYERKKWKVAMASLMALSISAAAHSWAERHAERWSWDGPAPDGAQLSMIQANGAALDLGAWGQEWTGRLPQPEAGATYRVDTPSGSQEFTMGARDRARLGMGSEEPTTRDLPQMDLVWIPPGEFEMGSPPGVGYDDERPQHPVKLTHGFFLASTETTQLQYLAIMGDNPSRFSGPYRGEAPVENVDWFSALEFCRRLTLREQVAGRLPWDWVYTLPTEAQWEYACRAGTTGATYLPEVASKNVPDLSQIAWFYENAGGQPQSVARLRPNPFGLFDMLGNVWEWTWDWYDSSFYSDNNGEDSSGPDRSEDLGFGAVGDDRVVRGGSWSYSSGLLRSAFRFRDTPSDSGYNLGFRVAAVRSSQVAERKGQPAGGGKPMEWVWAEPSSAQRQRGGETAEPLPFRYAVSRNPVQRGQLTFEYRKASEEGFSFDPELATVDDVENAISSEMGRSAFGFGAIPDGYVLRVAADSEVAPMTPLEPGVYVGIFPEDATVIPWIWMEPGFFTMGLPGVENADRDDAAWPVEIREPFGIGVYEVTQEQFEAVMSEPSGQDLKPGAKAAGLGFFGTAVAQEVGAMPEPPVQAEMAQEGQGNGSATTGPFLPATNVTWNEARLFCDRLTEMHRARGWLSADYRYDLPTEAQWEYAARAGTGTQHGVAPYHSLDGAVAAIDSASGPDPVGSYPPNAWGLHDMHGNAAEWCRDLYAPYPSEIGVDPVALEKAAPITESGKGRIVRGGSWKDAVENAACHARSRGGDTETGLLGFRIVVVRDNTAEKAPVLSMPLVWLRPGSFMMGSPESEPGRDSDETQRRIYLTDQFAIGKYEVTQGQYQTIMGRNPSSFKESSLLAPVESVDWNDASAFCERLTTLHHEAGLLDPGWEYSLPTEAQWEYACRAGTQTAFGVGNGSELDSSLANYEFNVGRTTAVGRYPANHWGIHDMHGNVWEWVLDGYGTYSPSDVVDPLAPDGDVGVIRVFRGGSWYYSSEFLRSAVRDGYAPSLSDDYLGFRVAAVRSSTSAMSTETDTSVGAGADGEVSGNVDESAKAVPQRQ